MTLGRVLSLAAAALLSGCFVSATGGGYLVETADGGYRPGFGLGFHLGVYLDADPVRVALGPGGDFAATLDSEDRHGVGVQGGTLEASYSLIRRFMWRGRLTGITSWGKGWAGSESDDAVSCDGDCDARAFFLGGTFDIPLHNGSVSASLGPQYISVTTPDQNHRVAVGVQLRLELSAVLVGAAKIFEGYVYRPPPGQCERLYGKEYGWHWKCGDS